jgi:DNA-binding HxlR family transcriptional regulator
MKMTDEARRGLTDSRRVGRVLTRVGDKWSVMVIVYIQDGPRRFNVIKRGIEGISQQMLARTLRGLERDGLVTRTIMPTSPPQVEYALTGLGRSLSRPVLALGQWACEHIDQVDEAQRRFDEHSASARPWSR